MKQKPQPQATLCVGAGGCATHMWYEERSRMCDSRATRSLDGFPFCEWHYRFYIATKRAVLEHPENAS